MVHDDPASPRTRAAVRAGGRCTGGRGNTGLGRDRSVAAPGRLDGVDGPGRTRATGGRAGGLGRRRDPRSAASLQLRGRLPAACDRASRLGPGDRSRPRAVRGDQRRVRRRLRQAPARRRRDRHRRDLRGQRHGGPGGGRRSVPRSIRYGHGRGGSGRIRRVAHARALRLDRAHLAAAVRPAPHSPHRQTGRARRPDRGVPHRHAAPLRAARRRARRREDGTRPGGARPGRGRDRVRGDRVPDPRRPGVRRRAGLAREAARRRDARPERGLGRCRSCRRPSSPASITAVRRDFSTRSSRTSNRAR